MVSVLAWRKSPLILIWLFTWLSHQQETVCYRMKNDSSLNQIEHDLICSHCGEVTAHVTYSSGCQILMRMDHISDIHKDGRCISTSSLWYKIKPKNLRCACIHLALVTSFEVCTVEILSSGPYTELITVSLPCYSCLHYDVRLPLDHLRFWSADWQLNTTLMSAKARVKHAAFVSSMCQPLPTCAVLISIHVSGSFMWNVGPHGLWGAAAFYG